MNSMTKWLSLLVFLLFLVLVALVIPVYSRAALGMGIGALAITLLNQVVENFNAK